MRAFKDHVCWSRRSAASEWWLGFWGASRNKETIATTCQWPEHKVQIDCPSKSSNNRRGSRTKLTVLYCGAACLGLRKTQTDNIQVYSNYMYMHMWSVPYGHLCFKILKICCTVLQTMTLARHWTTCHISTPQTDLISLGNSKQVDIKSIPCHIPVSFHVCAVPVTTVSHVSYQRAFSPKYQKDRHSLCSTWQEKQLIMISTTLPCLGTGLYHLCTVSHVISV